MKKGVGLRVGIGWEAGIRTQGSLTNGYAAARKTPKPDLLRPPQRDLNPCLPQPRRFGAALLPCNHKKARFFGDLGFTREEPAALVNALRALAVSGDVVRHSDSRHGRKLVVDGIQVLEERQAIVRTVWIVDAGQNVPKAGHGLSRWSIEDGGKPKNTRSSSPTFFTGERPSERPQSLRELGEQQHKADASKNQPSALCTR